MTTFWEYERSPKRFNVLSSAKCVFHKNYPFNSLVEFCFVSFFLFLAAPWQMEFLGQESDPGWSCNLCWSCGNTRYFSPLCWVGCTCILALQRHCRSCDAIARTHSLHPFTFLLSCRAASLFISTQPSLFISTQLALKFFLIPSSLLRSSFRTPHVLIQQEFVKQMNRWMDKLMCSAREVAKELEFFNRMFSWCYISFANPNWL